MLTAASPAEGHGSLHPAPCPGPHTPDLQRAPSVLSAPAPRGHRDDCPLSSAGAESQRERVRASLRTDRRGGRALGGLHTPQPSAPQQRHCRPGRGPGASAPHRARWSRPWGPKSGDEASTLPASPAPGPAWYPLALSADHTPRFFPFWDELLANEIRVFLGESERWAHLGGHHRAHAGGEEEARPRGCQTRHQEGGTGPGAPGPAQRPGGPAARQASVQSPGPPLTRCGRPASPSLTQLHFAFVGR